MDGVGGLMTGMGLGVFIYLKDHFSKQAAAVGASAGALEAKVAGSAAKINASMKLMTGGLLLGGAGIGGLMLGRKLAREYEDADKIRRSLLIKGFSKQYSDQVTALAGSIGATYGRSWAEAGTVAGMAIETGITDLRQMQAAAKPIFENMVGTGATAEAAAGLLRIRKELGYTIGDLNMLSGKIQVAEGLMQGAAKGALLAAMPEAIGIIKAFNIGLDDLLLNTIAIQRTGMDAASALDLQKQVLRALKTPGDEAAKMFATLPGVREAVAAQQYGKALGLISKTLSSMPAGERAGFLKQLGAAKPDMLIAMSALMDYAGERDKWQKQMEDWQARHVRAFKTEFYSYSNQARMLTTNLQNLRTTLGAGTAVRETGLLVNLNKLIVRADQFLIAHPKFAKGLTSWLMPLSRVALFSGLIAAGLGLMRSRLVKFGISAAENAGRLKLLGLAGWNLLKAWSPVLLVITGIALAFKGLQYSYRHNLLGFGDMVNGLLRKTTLFTKALVEGLSDTHGKISVDLASQLRKEGLYGLTQGVGNLMQGGRMFFRGLKEGITNTLGNPTMIAFSKNLMGSIASDLQSIMGNVIPPELLAGGFVGLTDMAGQGVGYAIGGMLTAQLTTQLLILAGIVKIANFITKPLLWGRGLNNLPGYSGREVNADTFINALPAVMTMADWVSRAKARVWDVNALTPAYAGAISPSEYVRGGGGGGASALQEMKDALLKTMKDISASIDRWEQKEVVLHGDVKIDGGRAGTLLARANDKKAVAQGATRQ